MQIDARGLKCPLPVLRAEKTAAGLKPGESFVLLATDPMATIDVPHFCAKAALLVEVTQDEQVTHFTITRPESPT